MSDAREENIVYIYLSEPNVLEIELSHQKILTILDDYELEKINQTKSSDAKKQFLASRILLKVCLGLHCNKKAVSFLIKNERNGKPFIFNNGGRSEVEFNVTHSQNIIAIGITKKTKIGIDSEFIDEKKMDLNLAKEYCCKYELNSINTITDPRRSINNMYAHWVSKEATLKCIGTGLAFEPKDIIFTGINESECHPRLIMGPSNIAPSRYKHKIIYPSENHILCVCTEDNDNEIKVELIRIANKQIYDCLS